MKYENLTDVATAQILILNAALYSEEKAKEVTRFRMTRSMFKKISRRGRLDDRFLFDVDNQMRKLGWLVVNQVSDTEIGFLKIDKAAVWPKIGAQRVRNLRDSQDVDRAFLDRFPGLEDDDSEDE